MKYFWRSYIFDFGQKLVPSDSQQKKTPSSGKILCTQYGMTSIPGLWGSSVSPLFIIKQLSTQIWGFPHIYTCIYKVCQDIQ